MAKTTQAEKNRRTADELSLRLYCFEQVLKQAAFAAEARRTLSEINNAIAFDPETENKLSERVEALGQWMEMEDTAGEVLRFVSCEIDIINQAFVNIIYHPECVGRAE